MEAGYFPRLVCALLIGVGAVLAVTALVRSGEHPERGMWRPFAFVTISCLAFALLLRPLGLVLTLLISTVLARLAGDNVRPIPLLLLCLVLIVAVVGLFVLALENSYSALAGILRCPTSCPISPWGSASR